MLDLTVERLLVDRQAPTLPHREWKTNPNHRPLSHIMEILEFSLPCPSREEDGGAVLSEEEETRLRSIETGAQLGVTKWGLMALLRERSEWPRPVCSHIADFITPDPASWNPAEVNLHLKTALEKKLVEEDAASWRELPSMKIAGDSLDVITAEWLRSQGVIGKETDILVEEIQNNLLPPDSDYDPYSFVHPKPWGKLQALKCCLTPLLVLFFLPCFPFLYLYDYYSSSTHSWCVIGDFENKLCQVWVFTTAFLAYVVLVVLCLMMEELSEWIPLLVILPIVTMTCLFVCFLVSLEAVTGCAPCCSFALFSLLFFLMTPPPGNTALFFWFAVAYAICAVLSLGWLCHVIGIAMDEEGDEHLCGETIENLEKWAGKFWEPENRV